MSSSDGIVVLCSLFPFGPGTTATAAVIHVQLLLMRLGDGVPSGKMMRPTAE
jgi:hypothetical protein